MQIATLVLYLNDVDEGGETTFPLEGEDGLERLQGIDYRSCDLGIKVKPRQGDAVLFFSAFVNGTLEQRSLHGACDRRQQRRRPALPAACAAKNSGGTAAKPRHFLRPSLLATGLTEPADVLQHCLALFRKADLQALQQYLPDSYAATLTDSGPAPDASSAAASSAAGASGSSSSSSGGSSRAGSSRAPLVPREPWLAVPEAGPLAALAGVLDVGARRVLPGHLLRRSQVLSTLRPAPGVFQQRISLTACTGETSVFDWQLAWHPEGDDGEAEGGGGGSSRGSDGSSSSSSSSSSDGSSSSSSSSSWQPGAAGRGRWVIESVRRDPSCDLPLPTTPHPKAAPEAIVRAQLVALQQGDVFGASCFSMHARPGRGLISRRTSLVSHHDALRTLLQREPYGLLLRHAVVQLGPAVLPTQREMLQEVAVMAADGASARFLWRLTLSSHSCWMASGILSANEAAAQLQAP
ncbi:hypothetical protein ABPG75_004765 [Micractinium tetrahymenae]